jgi:hypothetical protein
MGAYMFVLTKGSVPVGVYDNLQSAWNRLVVELGSPAKPQEDFWFEAHGEVDCSTAEILKLSFSNVCSRALKQRQIIIRKGEKKKDRLSQVIHAKIIALPLNPDMPGSEPVVPRARRRVAVCSRNRGA